MTNLTNPTFTASFTVGGIFDTKEQGEKVFAENDFVIETQEEDNATFVFNGTYDIASNDESEFIAKIKAHLDNPHFEPYFTINTINQKGEQIEFSEYDFEDEDDMIEIPKQYHFLSDVC